MKHQLIINHIVEWMNLYCENSKLSGFIVGVSGGIDSAVTSTLCAMTGKPVHAISMPIHQAEDQYDLSVQHIDWLCQNYPNVTKHVVDLTPSFQALESAIPADIRDPLSLANARSRIRMVCLYTFASHHRSLVAGTGNKVEDFGVGFFTKYGDGGVDLSPIADLMKTEVYALAQHMNVISGIQNAAPTDGLWDDGRTDEGQLGASYPELEWAMRFEQSNQPDDLLTQRQAEVQETYRRFHRSNLHKMEPIPVCQIPIELLS